MQANWIRKEVVLLTFLVTFVYGLDRPRAETGTAIPEFELPLHKYNVVKILNPIEAYRVESFGDMPIQVEVQGATNPELLVEGPFPEPGDSVEPGKGPVYKDFGNSSSAAFVLKQPGIYRVLIHTEPGENTRLVSSCTDSTLKKCLRPEITNQELMVLLRNNGELSTMIKTVEQKLDEYIANKFLRSFLKGQFLAFVNFFNGSVLNKAINLYLKTRDFSAVEHFPSVNIKYLPQLRTAGEMIKSHATEIDKPIQGEILDMVKNMTVDRSLPQTYPGLPDVGGGDFPNYAISRFQVAQGEVLANVLSKLASHDGSAVTLGGAGPFNSPEDLFDHLVKTGHTVTVRNERTYAAFIDFSSHGKYVKWPAWITLSESINNKMKVATPMGHSQFTWVIRGPLINTKVMFYLGISGADFFPVSHTRPPWTGLRAVYSISTDPQDPAGSFEVMQTIHYASIYLRRTRIERDTIAKGKVADGYGYVGVCNDSSAAIEKITHGTVSSFPLARDISLNTKAPNLNDGFDDVMRSLPHDADTPPSLSDLERRLFTTITFGSDENEQIPNPNLAGTMVEPYLGEELKAVTAIMLR